MGKVRSHIMNDGPSIAQWINRKLVNHHPMSEREEKQSPAARKALLGDRKKVEHTEGTNDVTYLLDDGREFKITVEEVSGKRV